MNGWRMDGAFESSSRSPGRVHPSETLARAFLGDRDWPIAERRLLISVDGLVVGFGDHLVLHHLDLDVAPGGARVTFTPGVSE